MKSLKQFMIDVLEDNKAENIISINVKNKSSITDIMILVSGRSTRHVQSIADNLINKLKKNKIKPLGIEGYSQCEVTIEVNIDIRDGRPDPSFDLGIKLNNVSFREGESLKIFLSPTQPMYINAFQFLPYISPEEQVTRIFPNSYDKNSFFP